MRYKIRFLIIFIISIFFLILDGNACTSFIISGKYTKSGRPLMMKHRDTGNLNNRVEYFYGPLFKFIAITDAPKQAENQQQNNYNNSIKRKINAAWTGTNSAGFSIMNTASYNLKDDNVPQSQMDREGILMFEALGICKNLGDFEHYLDTLSRPMGVEANFGVIDAEGGASYYEVNNHSWVKYDVNNKENAPYGYMVYTNFSRSGRPNDGLGVERYITSEAIFKDYLETKKVDDLNNSSKESLKETSNESSNESSKNLSKQVFDLSPSDIFNLFSRSYRHEILGLDYKKNYDDMIETPYFNGWAVDQDFIPRKSTSCSVVFEGVRPNENPEHTVMWTLLGYPACGVGIPLIVGEKNFIPYYMQPYFSENKTENMDKNSINWRNNIFIQKEHSIICDISMYIKMNFVYSRHISSGLKYVDLSNVIKGDKKHPALLDCCRNAEEQIQTSFNEIYAKWISGDISNKEFFKQYHTALLLYLDIYINEFQSFL